jgi:hypothetical protein
LRSPADAAGCDATRAERTCSADGPFGRRQGPHTSGPNAAAAGKWCDRYWRSAFPISPFTPTAPAISGAAVERPMVAAEPSLVQVNEVRRSSPPGGMSCRCPDRCADFRSEPRKSCRPQTGDALAVRNMRQGRKDPHLILEFRENGHADASNLLPRNPGSAATCFAANLLRPVRWLPDADGASRRDAQKASRRFVGRSGSRLIGRVTSARTGDTIWIWLLLNGPCGPNH